MMLDDTPLDGHRIAEHAKKCDFRYLKNPNHHQPLFSRCLNLIHDQPQRDRLLNVLIDAGESAWARGAHEVKNDHCMLISCSALTKRLSSPLNHPSVPGSSSQNTLGSKTPIERSSFCPVSDRESNVHSTRCTLIMTLLA